MAQEPCFGTWPLFCLLIYTYSGRTPWTWDQPLTMPLPTHRTQAQIKGTQTSMLRMGLEPTIPAFEQASTVHTSEGAATVICN
jgi:hypothetical protein